MLSRGACPVARVKKPPRERHPRSPGLNERQAILDTLHSERFCEPAEGAISCGIRPYAKPELLATHPNQVRSWDITKLRGPVKWAYFYL